MPLARSLYLLPLALACVSLSAQEPTGKPVEKGETTKVEISVSKSDEAKSEACCEKDKRKSRRYDRDSDSDSDFNFHFGHHSTFGVYVQGVMPLRELKENLDNGTGYGLGLQWTHDHGDWNASRTRLEWNTFPESGAVATSSSVGLGALGALTPLGTKTYAKNYTLSFDHIFKLNRGPHHAYLVTGLGGTRWGLTQTTGTVRNSCWTTKLAITGGIGVQVAERLNLEARYVVSSIGKTFDANTLQASLGWRF